jgi:hypothetical protein
MAISSPPLNIPNKNRNSPKKSILPANGKHTKTVRQEKASILDMVTAPNLSERYPENGNERIAPNARINKNPPNAAGLNSNRITKAGIRDAHIPKVLPLKIKALATITQSLENLDALI